MLNTIGGEQVRPTKKREHKLYRSLDYTATYQYAYIRYHASDMMLYVDCDAAYLVMSKARSRTESYCQLLDYPTKQGDLTGPLLVECKALHNMVVSAAEVEAEVEIGGLYNHNAQTSVL